MPPPSFTKSTTDYRDTPTSWAGRSAKQRTRIKSNRKSSMKLTRNSRKMLKRVISKRWGTKKPKKNLWETFIRKCINHGWQWNKVMLIICKRWPNSNKRKNGNNRNWPRKSKRNLYDQRKQFNNSKRYKLISICFRWSRGSCKKKIWRRYMRDRNAWLRGRRMISWEKNTTICRVWKPNESIRRNWSTTDTGIVFRAW